jgi:hypothetical protein
MNTIKAMIDAAIGGDVLTDKGHGFVSIMGKSGRLVQQDIPAAFEAYTLLSYFLATLPLTQYSSAITVDSLQPALHYDREAGRLLALLPVERNELQSVAFWLTDSMKSDLLKKMPGILALPFTVEEHMGVDLLLPEWFAAFYVNSDPGHCIPLLLFHSVLSDSRFSDWVRIALERMAVFGLPQTAAKAELEQWEKSKW